MAVTASELPSAHVRPVGFQRRWVKFSSFGVAHRISLYRRLERFAQRGRDEKFALSGMYTRFKGKKDERAVVWRDWLRGLDGGLRFSTLLLPYVPAAEALAISAGEDTAERDRGFRMASFIATSGKTIRSSIVGALFYPGLLLAVLAGLMFFAAYKLLPAMIDIAPLENWPTMALALYHFAGFIKDWGWAVLLGSIGLGIVVARSLSRWQSPLRRKLDRWLPPYNVYRIIQGANLLVILAALGQAGTPFDESVRRVRRISSPWINWHLDMILRRLNAGAKASEAIDTGLLQEEVLGDLIDYDKAGAFNDALEAIGIEVVEATINAIGPISQLVRYLLMAACAGGVLWIWGSMAMLVMSVRGGVQ